MKTDNQSLGEVLWGGYFEEMTATITLLVADCLRGLKEVARLIPKSNRSTFKQHKMIRGLEMSLRKLTDDMI